MNQQKHIIKSPSPPGPTTQQGQVMPFAVVFILLICAVFFFSVS